MQDADTSSQPAPWDFFIAHSSADKATAEELYGYLAGEFRVFLDSRTLQYGDDWDMELSRAQQRSKVTLVLVSNHTESSYYQREEIAVALAMSRANSAAHRVVPCFLDRAVSQREDIPYGLRLKHGISVEEAGGLKQLAEKLAQLGRQPSDGSSDASGILKLTELVGAATTAFVGRTIRGPVGRPMLLTSWREYERAFGSHTDPQISFLSHAVKGFFENGGKRAYVVRVAPSSSTFAGARLATSDEEGLSFRAVSVGAWGNSLRVRLEPGARTDLRILVLHDRPGQRPELLEDYDNLSFDRNRSNFYLREFNNQSEYLRAEPTALFSASAMPLNVETQLCGGTDGSSLTAAEYIGGAGADIEQRTGLVALEGFNDVSILCVPDHVHPSLDAGEQARITDAVIDYCERLGDHFAILSVPSSVPASALRGPRDTRIAATYYPWVRVSSGATGEPILIPPVGHVAGAYAKSDVERGVHNSPAGHEICGLLCNSQPGNGPIEFEVLGDAVDRLQRIGINPIAGDGEHVRMLTAFTMAIDKRRKEIAAERLLLFVSKSLRLGTLWALFEPNNEQLWEELRASIAEFLNRLWKSGALVGRTAGEAYSVQCCSGPMGEGDISVMVSLTLPSSAGPSILTLSFTINQAC